jgi:hypothetical protein
LNWSYNSLEAKALLHTTDSGAYLGFEIAGANKTISPVFLIDRFLYTVSYKPILSVIDLINWTKEYSFF